jgi:hypothetical protein
MNNPIYERKVMKKNAPWKKFLLLWLFLLLSYLIIKIAFNLAVYGWIDLRKNAFLELLILPLGQSVLFWIIYRPGRNHPAGGNDV